MRKDKALKQRRKKDRQWSPCVRNTVGSSGGRGGAEQEGWVVGKEARSWRTKLYEDFVTEHITLDANF